MSDPPVVDLEPHEYQDKSGRKWRRGPNQRVFVAIGTLAAAWAGFFRGWGYEFFHFLPYQVWIIAMAPFLGVILLYAVLVEISDER